MEDHWTLNEICRKTGGALLGNPGIPVQSIAIDSRTVAHSENTIFVALLGDQHNGHDYIKEVYDRGIRAFMVSVTPDLRSFPEAGFCQVKDTLTGLQELAEARRQLFKGEVAAITGSNGKTIVKEWIYHCLREHLNVYRSPKSYNSQVGVPLSVWMIGASHDLAVIEAGISQPGEMDKLRKIIKPRIGILTNLGTAHQEHFRSYSEKLAEKVKLFSDCDKVICRLDVTVVSIPLRSFLEGFKAEIVGWSLGGTADYMYSVEMRTGKYTRLKADCPAGRFSFQLPFSDDASIENALHALTFSIEAGLTVPDAVEKMESLEPVSMRLEMLQGILGSVLINDAYNSDIGGLSAALDMMNQQDPGGEKTVILSDLLQSGMEEVTLYTEIATLIRQKKTDHFIGIGAALMKQRSLFPENSHFYHNTGEFLKRMDRTLFKGQTILIKGSRKFGFERITGELQLKVHLSQLEIDLSSMVHNLNYFRSLLNEGVKTLVMIKALSYGSGNIEIANLLQFHHVDYLAVAFIDEGIELRQSGISLPIMVLNPDPTGFGPLIDYRLEPEIYSLRGLEAIFKILHFRGISHYPVHIKLDTGMHRLGFQEEDISDIIPFLRRKELNVASVFTHLAASDDEAHDEFTRMQIHIFDRTSRMLSGSLDQSFDKHVLNSAGIERFPEAQYDMVRLGIGLHGIGLNESLRPVSSFKTTVSQIRKVRKGESVGYSRSGKVGRESLIATIPVGYADGFHRILGNGRGKVWIKDTLVPTIGNICMDMSMIDVTGLDISEGDDVELFGKNQPVTALAEMAETIPYEILTSIPGRVKRVYLQE